MVTMAARACPVCGGRAGRQLFRQHFGSLSEGSLLAGYALTVCGDCGGAYADGIPDQHHFDRYYSEMSKYEYADTSGAQSESYLQSFRDMADLLVPHLRTSDRVLDIGCATGGLLAEFKRRGYTQLMGVDPSPACARLVQELHGIEARAGHISALQGFTESFDAVLLTGVLEHLREVDPALAELRSCLRPGGLVYIEVPDASRYDQHFSAAFQFFSMEHINFFAPTSLSSLLARHGFDCVFSTRQDRRLSPHAIEPTVAALFRLNPDGPARADLQRDEDTEPALRRYIQQSSELEQRILAKVGALADAGRPLAVWGTGTHTLRLMETSRLANANIMAFIDSNPNYQGKTLAGVPVLAPSAFTDREAAILISSQAAEDEIFRFITQSLRWTNPVHRLYGH